MSGKENVVAGEKFAVGAGAADFHLASAHGVEPVGTAPSIDELSPDDGTTVGGEVGGALFIFAEERGDDVLVLSNGISPESLTINIEELSHGVELVCGIAVGAVECGGKFGCDRVRDDGGQGGRLVCGGCFIGSGRDGVRGGVLLPKQNPSPEGEDNGHGDEGKKGSFFLRIHS